MIDIVFQWPSSLARLLFEEELVCMGSEMEAPLKEIHELNEFFGCIPRTALTLSTYPSVIKSRGLEFRVNVLMEQLAYEMNTCFNLCICCCSLLAAIV